MAPPFASATLTLSYPIYASDFDPRNSDFLVVGGGGGEGRSGVGNKITLIDASKKHELAEVVDIDLSRDEDSVTSLSIAKSDEGSATVYAGINSSEKEIAQGRNEHLRAFRLGYPAKRRKTDSEEKNGDKGRGDSGEDLKTEALGKSALFGAANGGLETYQRILRLSSLPQRVGASRLGVVATGLAPRGEIIIFNASKDAPTEADVIKRIQLGEKEEAADVDLIEENNGGFLVAYCTDYEIYICPLAASAKGKSSSPRLLHSIPVPDVFVPGQRHKFRSLRFLTPRLLVVVLNRANRSGIEVLLLNVPEERALEGRILLRKSLHAAAKSATCLATTLLPPASSKQNMQHAIAIAGHDSSITVLTLDHSSTSTRSYSFDTYAVLKNVHPLQITSLSFSTFTPPAAASSAGPQYVKLASSGMSSTVTVHTLPLTPHPSISKKEASRYILRSPSSKRELAQMSFSVLVAVVMVALGAFLLQAFTEIRGGTPEYLGAKSWLSKGLHDRLARPYMFAESPVIVDSMPDFEGSRAERVAKVASEGYEAVKSAVPDTQDVINAIPDMNPVAPLPIRLKEILLQRQIPEDADRQGKAVVVSHDEEHGLSTEFHGDEHVLKEKTKRWEELEHHEKSAWLKRLEAAGEWTVEQGEGILKGIFFGELAGAVGDAAAGL